MRDLLPLLEAFAQDGRYEGLCLVAGPEWQLDACPFPMRSYEEFSGHCEPESLCFLKAARRAILEEKPGLLLTSQSEAQWQALEPLVASLGLEWRQCRATIGAPTTRATLQPLAASPRPEPLPELASDLAPLARSPEPEERLLELLRQGRRLNFSEPVNLDFAGARHRFRYRRYDNEFALRAADLDLHQLLSRHLQPHQFRVEVTPQRPGNAGEDPYLEACDGRMPLFRIEIDPDGLEPKPWHQRFADGGQAQLKLLLLDLHNVAGSGMQQAQAIHRYSRSQATVLCQAPHPFIQAPERDCRVLYAAQGWNSELLQALQEADLLVYWEDDDADTLQWPEAFRQLALQKPSLHLYVGQRVHSQAAQRRARQRTALMGLPHLLRVYPESKFYPGFYPLVLEDLKLRPPLSREDGVVRVLHTPSLPHATQHRYLYHKDTSSYLSAARTLKARHPKVRFLQMAGVPHRKVLEHRQDCDIAFHQLRGFTGMAGNEALFLGRPTIQATDQENLNRHLEFWGLDCQLPWIEADRSNLTEVLEALILDADRRQEIGENSRRFMLEYMHPGRGIQILLHHALRAIEEKAP